MDVRCWARGSLSLSSPLRAGFGPGHARQAGLLLSGLSSEPNFFLKASLASNVFSEGVLQRLRVTPAWSLRKGGCGRSSGGCAPRGPELRRPVGVPCSPGYSVEAHARCSQAPPARMLAPGRPCEAQADEVLADVGACGSAQTCEAPSEPRRAQFLMAPRHLLMCLACV